MEEISNVLGEDNVIINVINGMKIEANWTIFEHKGHSLE